MFSSLRSRLLLTYILLIGVILCVVGVAIVFYLLRNPLIDRQVYNRLEGIASLINRQSFVTAQAQDRLETLINRIDLQSGVRVLIISSTGEVMLDSRVDEAASLNLNIQKAGEYQRRIIQDSDGTPWYTIWERLGNGNYLVLATMRIGRVSLLFTQRLRELLRDDLLPPLLQSGIIAIFLALFLSILMANWITSPLRRISEATRQVSMGKYEEVSIEGPRETRTLAHSFNEMVNQVNASQQSQKDFVSNVSHELKTPLTAIQGFAQAVVDGTIKSQTERIEAAKVILTEAGRMSRLVGDLLELARLEARTITLQRSTIDLEMLLSQVVEKFRPQATSRELEISFESTVLPKIIGDEDRLMQVFTNLVDNAIKYTPPGGTVQIKGSGMDDYVLVEIEDSGTGISPEEVTRIFERFYQVDKSRAGDRRGTGLGLSIAKEIIQAHGGSIEVKSQEGRGSCFKVIIPVEKKDEAPELNQKRKKFS